MSLQSAAAILLSIIPGDVMDNEKSPDHRQDDQGFIVSETIAKRRPAQGE